MTDSGMTYSGTMHNGVVVLETDNPPPEGARVMVEVEGRTPDGELGGNAAALCWLFGRVAGRLRR